MTAVFPANPEAGSEESLALSLKASTEEASTLERTLEEPTWELIVRQT